MLAKAEIWAWRRLFTVTRLLHRGLALAGHALYPSPFCVVPYLLAKPVFRFHCLLFEAIWELQDRQISAAKARIAALRSDT